MRAIVSGNLEGFPSPDEVRTVYVEHDIDASVSETSVRDFILNDAVERGYTAGTATLHPDTDGHKA